MKTVYIAHPIRGDIIRNTNKVLDLLNKYHTEEILPLAPYLIPLQYLDDSKPEERAKGIKASKELFKRGVFDELWVCGDKISDGMKSEIALAHNLGISIKAP